VAVGNDIDTKRISGKVDVVGANRLPDVQGYWAQPYIEALAAKKVIAGFPGGTFKPNEPVALSSPLLSAKPLHRRLNANHLNLAMSAAISGATTIQSAYRGGFVAGYPGGVFQPQQHP